MPARTYYIFGLVGVIGIIIGAFVPYVGQSIRGAAGFRPTPGIDQARAQSGADSRSGGGIGKSLKDARNTPKQDTSGDDKPVVEGLVKLTQDQIVAQEIDVAAVQGGFLSRHIIVPGTIAPDVNRIARVPARVVGTVAEMRKQLGDMVEKDEVVAVLDSREVADAKSEYLTASVNFDLQKTNFDRAQGLWDKRISAEQQYLQVRASFSEAQLRVDLARQKLSALGIDASEVASTAIQDTAGSGQSSLRKYELRSPMSGRIVDRKVDVGTAVGKEGDPADLYTVADLSTVWIDLTVTPGDLSKVREGAKVSIATNDDDEKRAEARIMFVSPILNPETRSARVIASLGNKDLSWRPGSFVTAEIEIAREQAKILVPRSALQSISGERVVFVKKPEGFQRRDVKVGQADDAVVEILAGLSPAEEIAVKNTFLLKAELGKTEAKHDD
jgi:cobalt-zinc-cadmium efflux system membrane fusion protein